MRARRGLLIWVGLAALIVVAVGIAIDILRPTPPRKVVMITGPDGSAYAQFATRYREILARDGIRLELRPSGGGVANLAALNDPESDISIGLLSAGLTTATESPDLVSLGTLFEEPLWMFYRSTGGELDSAALKGTTWSIGPAGSRSRPATIVLLRLLGMDPDFAEFLDLAPREAAHRLIAGDIDVLVMVAPGEAPLIRELLGREDIELAHFPRADAYTMLYPYLSKLIVYEGVGSLALNRPSRDTALIAAPTSLVVRRELHPAIQMLLLGAIQEVHGGAGLFHKAGRFPAPEPGDFPLSETATQYYKSGQPFLQRYLPFWLAVFMAQVLVAAIPIVGILYPALRLMPSAYDWAMRRRIYRMYGELKFLENRLGEPGSENSLDEIVAQLDRLEDRIQRLRVPTTFTHLLYTLRGHVTLVRQRLEARRAATH